MSNLIATFFFVGHLKPAPGTWGSLAAIPAFWAVLNFATIGQMLILTALLFALGWWATYDVTKGSTDHDPSEIVIDEVVGQWIALWPIALNWSFSSASFWSFWPAILVAFLAFRAFDILKPGPVGWADRQEGPLGVMLDDVIAGVFAAIVVIALMKLVNL